MTEQIKSAIEDFQEWIDRAEEFKPNMLSDHVKAMKLTIRSLQAWSEVLNELEEKKDVYKLVPISNTAMGKAYTYDESTICMAIDIINQHLADVPDNNVGEIEE